MLTGLVTLQLRRGLRPWLLLATGALVALALAGDPPREWMGEQAAAGAWLRRELWTVALLVLWPVALLNAAGLAGKWRAGELDWLAPRVRSLGRALAASWLGGLAALLVGVSLVAVLAELAGGPAPHLVDGGFRPGAVVTETDSAAARRWTIELPETPVDAMLAVQVQLRGYRGPAVDAGLSVRRGAAETRWTGRLGRAREVLVELPPGSGPAQLTLERLSDGAVLLVREPGARLYLPASRAAGAAGLFLRVALGAALSLALAIGFGAWVSTASALLAVAALWITVWIGDAPWSLPADDLFAALDALGRGRAAGAIPLGSWVTTIAGCALGLGLASFGLARQRRAA